MKKLRNIGLSIATTAGIILFTTGFLSMIEKENYLMAVLFLFFAFWLPLQSRAIEDKLIDRDLGSPNHRDAEDDSMSKETKATRTPQDNDG